MEDLIPITSFKNSIKVGFLEKGRKYSNGFSQEARKRIKMVVSEIIIIKKIQHSF